MNQAPFLNFLSEIRFIEATIVLGFIEKSSKNLYNSVAIIEKGKLLHIQRKHYLYYNYFTPGFSYLPVVCKGIKIGVIICLDALYFEPSHLLASKGAEIIFCPMCNKVPLSHPYSKRPAYYPQFAARSFENRCWFIASDWVCPNDGTLSCPGHSCIYNPNGEEVIRSNEFQEEFINYSIPTAQLHMNKGKRFHGSETLKNKF